MPGGSIRIDDESDAAVIVLVGEHDLAAAPSLRQTLAAAEARSAALVIDLCEAQFIDSTVLGILIAAQERARSASRGFAVAVSPDSGHAVHRILEVTGLAEFLCVHERRDAAVAAAVGAGA